MSLTASEKDEFSTWMLKTIKESADIIAAANPSVTYDVAGNLANLQAKDDAYKAEMGKIAPLKAAAIKQVGVVNDLRDDEYKVSSAIADSVSGHMGKDNTLSIIIHQKRDSLSNPANRGPRKPKTDETANEDTPSTDTPTV